MVAGLAERRRNFVANKMENSLRILQLEEALTELQLALDRSERDCELLAEALCRTNEFGEWLMGQDTSSMMTYRTPVVGSEVEDQDDLTLALRYAGRPNAG